MKTLYIFRHGIAVERGARGVSRDEDRPLTAEGRRKTGAALRGLLRTGCPLDRIVSSPLVRARETAALARELLLPEGTVDIADELAPGTAPVRLVEWLADRPADERLMVVGHMPDLGALASMLLCGRTDACILLKKAGVCALSFDGPVGPGRGRLDFLLQPGSSAGGEPEPMSTRKKPAGDNAQRFRGAEKYRLYEAAVQAPDHNLLFLEQTFRRRFNRALKTLREDFCGTARLACEWVSWGANHEAWGVDLDPGPLAWGQAEHVDALGEAADRVHLLEGDVRTVQTPPVDAAVAFNFSYWVFKARNDLRAYFRHAFQSLASPGLLVMDLFGGPSAQEVVTEKRKVKGKTDHRGAPLPTFTYVWEQARFNAVRHDLLCRIHFRFRDGSEIQRAFTYDWRLWSIPELTDLLREAGFADVAVHTHGWDDDGTSNDVYKKVDHFENEQAWLAYLVAVKT